jgi:hypothetical protein
MPSFLRTYVVLSETVLVRYLFLICVHLGNHSICYDMFHDMFHDMFVH